MEELPTEEDSRELRQRTRALTEDLKSKMKSEELERFGAQYYGCSRTQQAVDHHTARGIHQAEQGFRVPEDRNVRARRLYVEATAFVTYHRAYGDFVLE
jgi:hypothetical protein